MWFCISVADPHHVDADPDPACHFDADPDPDPAYNFNTDTDLTVPFNFMQIRIHNTVLYPAEAGISNRIPIF
jgi:hypothetical protein